MNRPTARTLGLLLLAALPLAAGAQKLKERMATRYADDFDYPAMAKVYQDLADKGKADATDLRRLAMAYKRMGRMDLAEATYASSPAARPAPRTSSTTPRCCAATASTPRPTSSMRATWSRTRAMPARRPT
ncbi:MAG: hypothetical protein IPG35_06625 [Flavobacteriales bacterium]|nr:hypothetical protein [Flavobacteriales bacterium]